MTSLVHSVLWHYKSDECCGEFSSLLEAVSSIEIIPNISEKQCLMSQPGCHKYLEWVQLLVALIVTRTILLLAFFRATDGTYGVAASGGRCQGQKLE